MMGDVAPDAVGNARVTVVIPVHNRPERVLLAIASALGQSVSPLEVLVVDDGSTDDTVAKVRGYGDARVRCIELGTNRGAQFARIRGVEEARGDFVAFLDSDDEMLPFSIEKRLQALVASGWSEALVYGDVTRSGEIVPFERLHGHCYPYLLRELSLCCYSVILVPVRCFAVTGLPDADFPSWQDDDMVLTVGRHFPVLHCGAAVAAMTGSGISNNQEALLEGCRKIVDKYAGEILAIHGRFRLRLWRLRIERHRVIVKWWEVRCRMYESFRFVDAFRLFALSAARVVLRTLLKPFFRHIYV